MSTTASKDNQCKILTGIVRLSFASIWSPKPTDDGKMRYSTSILIPKTDTVTIAKIRAATEAAYRDGEGVLRGAGKTVPPLATLKTPLRDGDAERSDDPTYKGHWFLNASTYEKPGVVDLNRKEITDESEVYSGAYARVSLRFYAYFKRGNRGVAAGLQNIQKVHDGDRLGGKTRAEDDFDDNFVDDYVPDDDFLA